MITHDILEIDAVGELMASARLSTGRQIVNSYQHLFNKLFPISGEYFLFH
jgi:hypothetical protein